MEVKVVNFTVFIHSLIKDVMNKEFKTIGSLNLIIGKLDDLPDIMKENYQNAINMIKMTIKRLHENRFDFHELTDGQIDTILFTLTEVTKLKVKYTKKLLPVDDMVITATTMLLLNLNQNILSSNITNFIQNYVEIIDMALAEEYNTYIDFHSKIMAILEKQGWIKNRGFQREPKKLELIKEIDELLQETTI